MNEKYNSYFRFFLLCSIFSVPALLLSTPNFSVGFIILSFLTSTYYLIINRKKLSIGHYDIIIAVCFSFYFLGAIPIAVLDGTTMRYFQGGIRLLLCLPIYLAVSQFLKTTNTNFISSFEFGVIIGSLGALIIALYQYFHLSMPRVDGFLFSINFGYLACSLAFLSLSLITNSSRKALLIVAFISAIISVNLSFTRGAIFAIPLLLTLCAVLKIKQIKIKTLVTTTILFIACILISYNYSTSFKNRINYTIYEFSNIASGDINNADSSGDRLQYWYASIEAFKKRPIIGLTYKERESLNHELFLQGKMGERASKVNRGHAHSQYFEMLASNGILGIISIFSIFILPLIILFSHYRRTNSKWAFSGIVFVSGFSIFSLTEVPLTANLIGAYYGFMLAVFLAQVSAEKYKKEHSSVIL